jgi:hypothetical protein
MKDVKDHEEGLSSCFFMNFMVEPPLPFFSGDRQEQVSRRHDKCHRGLPFTAQKTPSQLRPRQVGDNVALSRALGRTDRLHQARR